MVVSREPKSLSFSFKRNRTSLWKFQEKENLSQLVSREPEPLSLSFKRNRTSLW
jgi:hypothetical protein